MAYTAPSAKELRFVILQLTQWLEDDEATLPTPQDALFNNVAKAVRGSVYTMAHVAPGHSVEVRIPPFAAAQCIDGPRHTRGTPPNVVETDPHTWLCLATGLLHWEDAINNNLLSASGNRAAEVAHWLPIVPISAPPSQK